MGEGLLYAGKTATNGRGKRIPFRKSRATEKRRGSRKGGN